MRMLHAAPPIDQTSGRHSRNLPTGVTAIARSDGRYSHPAQSEVPVHTGGTPCTLSDASAAGHQEIIAQVSMAISSSALTRDTCMLSLFVQLLGSLWLSATAFATMFLLLQHGCRCLLMGFRCHCLLMRTHAVVVFHAPVQTPLYLNDATVHM